MLARTVFHGKRGELRQRYRQGQEDQLSALGLAVNIIVLWNTIYMDATPLRLRTVARAPSQTVSLSRLRQLPKEGFEVREEDVGRLSPLAHAHINMLGRYAFSLPDRIARGELRPSRRQSSGC
jgi:Tn3 transposase DDE domain